jgi:hypothetical protein
MKILNIQSVYAVLLSVSCMGPGALAACQRNPISLSASSDLVVSQATYLEKRFGGTVAVQGKDSKVGKVVSAVIHNQDSSECAPRSVSLNSLVPEGFIATAPEGSSTIPAGQTGFLSFHVRAPASAPSGEVPVNTHLVSSEPEEKISANAIIDHDSKVATMQETLLPAPGNLAIQANTVFSYSTNLRIDDFIWIELYRLSDRSTIASKRCDAQSQCSVKAGSALPKGDYGLRVTISSQSPSVSHSYAAVYHAR